MWNLRLLGSVTNFMPIVPGTSEQKQSNVILLSSGGHVERVCNPNLHDSTVLILVIRLRLRDKLLQYNTISDAVELIRNSKRMLILTGAGISVYPFHFVRPVPDIFPNPRRFLWNPRFQVP